MVTEVQLLMVDTYGCDIWIVKTTVESRRETLKMRVLSQILLISWLSSEPTTEYNIDH